MAGDALERLALRHAVLAAVDAEDEAQARRIARLPLLHNHRRPAVGRRRLRPDAHQQRAALLLPVRAERERALLELVLVRLRHQRHRVRLAVRGAVAPRLRAVAHPVAAARPRHALAAALDAQHYRAVLRVGARRVLHEEEGLDRVALRVPLLVREVVLGRHHVKVLRAAHRGRLHRRGRAARPLAGPLARARLGARADAGPAERELGHAEVPAQRVRVERTRARVVLVAHHKAHAEHLPLLPDLRREAERALHRPERRLLRDLLLRERGPDRRAGVGEHEDRDAVEAPAPDDVERALLADAHVEVALARLGRAEEGGLVDDHEPEAHLARVVVGREAPGLDPRLLIHVVEQLAALDTDLVERRLGHRARRAVADLDGHVVLVVLVARGRAAGRAPLAVAAVEFGHIHVGGRPDGVAGRVLEGHDEVEREQVVLAHREHLELEDLLDHHRLVLPRARRRRVAHARRQARLVEVVAARRRDRRRRVRLRRLHVHVQARGVLHVVAALRRPQQVAALPAGRWRRHEGALEAGGRRVGKGRVVLGGEGGLEDGVGAALVELVLGREAEEEAAHRRAVLALGLPPQLHVLVPQPRLHRHHRLRHGRAGRQRVRVPDPLQLLVVEQPLALDACPAVVRVPEPHPDVLLLVAVEHELRLPALHLDRVVIRRRGVRSRAHEHRVVERKRREVGQLVWGVVDEVVRLPDPHQEVHLRPQHNVLRVLPGHLRLRRRHDSNITVSRVLDVVVNRAAGDPIYYHTRPGPLQLLTVGFCQRADGLAVVRAFVGFQRTLRVVPRAVLKALVQSHLVLSGMGIRGERLEGVLGVVTLKEEGHFCLAISVLPVRKLHDVHSGLETERRRRQPRVLRFIPPNYHLSADVPRRTLAGQQHHVMGAALSTRSAASLEKHGIHLRRGSKRGLHKEVVEGEMRVNNHPRNVRPRRVIVGARNRILPRDRVNHKTNS
mmetsp:Transcript_21350/g.50654  ORF Transcript_21350/g.50654 Transcript_21350/m.50654 type:complete len:956 (+) Transcript_21350:491-3358(+)